VASRLLRDADERMVVALPGGELDIEWTGGVATAAPVLMTGSVTKSFAGEFNPKEYE
jgi:diaminopimelate epimerase